MCTRDAKQPLTSIKGTLVKFGSQKLLLLLLQKISPLFLRVTAQTGVHMIYEDGFCWVGFCVGLVRVVGCGKLCLSVDGVAVVPDCRAIAKRRSVNGPTDFPRVICRAYRSEARA